MNYTHLSAASSKEKHGYSSAYFESHRPSPIGFIRMSNTQLVTPNDNSKIPDLLHLANIYAHGLGKLWKTKSEATMVLAIDHLSEHKAASLERCGVTRGIPDGDSSYSKAVRFHSRCLCYVTCPNRTVFAFDARERITGVHVGAWAWASGCWFAPCSASDSAGRRKDRFRYLGLFAFQRIAKSISLRAPGYFFSPVAESATCTEFYPRNL